MIQDAFTQQLYKLGELINQVYPSLKFTMLEIGALPVEGVQEPFHQILDIFPSSQVIGFELDEKLCEELNNKAQQGFKFYPVALGLREEERSLYQTQHSMGTSLFKPNEDLLDLYVGLEVMKLERVTKITTTSLDTFISQHHIDNVDFIKIDVQGAELDVFKGGVDTLQNVLGIVSEVLFIPLYLNQPLFGDIYNFLREQKLSFHKFLGMAGRSLKPIVIGGDLEAPIQHMWSDAYFIRDIQTLTALTSEKLLKMSVLTFLYRSPDVAFHCLRIFDERHNTNLHQLLIQL